MQRSQLRQMSRKQMEGLAREAGERINAGLIDRFNRRLHRMHWFVLVLGVVFGWGADWAVNTVLHGLTLVGGLGYLIDTIMGPIDAALVVAIPAVSFKELLRRSWVKFRSWGWFRKMDVYLFGAEPEDDILDAEPTT